MDLNKKILITGSAGFIGFHLCLSYLEDGFEVIGIDNINDYYCTKLKNNRLNKLYKYKNFTFLKVDIANFKELKNVFEKFNFNIVINLAAQAGVRYSIENPFAYLNSNFTLWIKGGIVVLVFVIFNINPSLPCESKSCST